MIFWTLNRQAKIFLRTHDNLSYDSARPESCKKNVPYNLAKRIVVFVTDPEKVELRLSEFRTWLKMINIPIIF